MRLTAASGDTYSLAVDYMKNRIRRSVFFRADREGLEGFLVKAKRAIHFIQRTFTEHYKQLNQQRYSIFCKGLLMWSRGDSWLCALVLKYEGPFSFQYEQCQIKGASVQMLKVFKYEVRFQSSYQIKQLHNSELQISLRIYQPSSLQAQVLFQVREDFQVDRKDTRTLEVLVQLGKKSARLVKQSDSKLIVPI